MNIQLLYSSQANQSLIIKSITTSGLHISGYANVYNIPDQHNDLIVKEEFAATQLDSITLTALLY